MKKRIILFFAAMVVATGMMTAQYIYEKGPCVDRSGTGYGHYDVYYGQDHRRYDRQFEGKRQKHLKRLYRQYEKTERKAWRDGHLSYNEVKKLQRLEHQIAQVRGTITQRDHRYEDRRYRHHDNRRERTYGYHRPDRHHHGAGCH